MICAVALVLLLDASGSVNDEEWSLITDGHAHALESEDVGRVAENEGFAVTVASFAGDVRTMMGWRVLRSREDAAALAAEIRSHERANLFTAVTAIGQAVVWGLNALERAPCGDRQVLDLATDGVENGGRVRALEARTLATAADVVINTIAVPTDRNGADIDWLSKNVSTPGGFTLEATTWPAFFAAMRRKLIMELAGITP